MRQNYLEFCKSSNIPRTDHIIVIFALSNTDSFIACCYKKIWKIYLWILDWPKLDHSFLPVFPSRPHRSDPFAYQSASFWIEILDFRAKAQIRKCYFSKNLKNGTKSYKRIKFAPPDACLMSSKLPAFSTLRHKVRTNCIVDWAKYGVSSLMAFSFVKFWTKQKSVRKTKNYLQNGWS